MQTLRTTIYVFFFLFPLSLSSFHLSLFKDLSSLENDNIIFSPLSAYQALSLTSNGAKGETQIQMINTLDHSDQIETNICNYNILENVKPCLQIANAVLSTFEPERNFIEVSKKYNALASKLISVNQINQWCAEKTNNKITKILDDIQNIQMIILNAVYFKSEWKHSFQTQMTSIQPFSNKDGSISQVKMMKQKQRFKYFENKDIQSIELDYIHKGLSAFIILPKKHIDIREYINNLTDDEIANIHNNMSYEKVMLHLPKFEIEFKTSLVNSLKKMGMLYPFDKSKADFSNISTHVSLYIDNIIQKAYLKVDEKGSEAAAVTAITMKLTSAAPSVEIPRHMIIERPFIFMIKDSDIKEQMLFIAKIEKLNSIK